MRLAVVVVCAGGEFARAREVDAGHVYREHDMRDSVLVGVNMGYVKHDSSPRVKTNS